MLTRRGIAVVFASLTVAHATSAVASAQDPQPSEVRRPYRGLFGAPSSSDSPHSLVASASVFAAYDDNVHEGLAGRRVGSPLFQQSGVYQGANAGLNYGFEMDGERVDFRAQSGAQVNYYRHEEESDVLPAYQGSGELALRLTQSTTLNLRQNVAYSSVYASTLAPQVDEDLGREIGVADDLDFGLFQQRAVIASTRVNLSQSFGRYATLGASYHLRARRSLETEVKDSPLREYASHAATAGFQYVRPMTRHATLRLGYGIRWSDRKRVSGEPEFMHNIDAGVDYSRALSFSRRTFLTFGTGSAITVSDEVPVSENERRIQAWLTGNAALVHEIGRTWTANLRYSRGFRTREGFDQLYFTDALTASIGGLVTQRLSLNGSAAWAQSSLAQDASSQQRNRWAAAKATYGITSFLALYASYIYLQYRSDEGLLPDDGFPAQLDRQGVRVGLTTSFPLIR